MYQIFHYPSKYKNRMDQTKPAGAGFGADEKGGSSHSA